MKIIELKSLPLPVWVVELPEGSKNIRIGDWGNFVYDSPIEGEFTVDMLVPLGSDFIGKFTDLNDVDFEGLVYWFTTDEDFGKENVFRDYSNTSFFDTARESFISAIEAEGWYLGKNPFDNTVDLLEGNIEEEKLKYNKWKQGQEKVIDLNRCYVFVKEDK